MRGIALGRQGTAAHRKAEIREWREVAVYGPAFTTMNSTLDLTIEIAADPLDLGADDLVQWHDSEKWLLHDLMIAHRPSI